jgi:hypothetical protein
MERKEVLKYITSQITEGKAKKAIYKELLPKVLYKSDLLSYISEIPDLNIMKQIRGINIVLIAMLAILIFLHSIEAVLIFRDSESVHIPWLVLGGWFYFILPIVLLFVIADVWRFRRRGYQTFFLYTILMLTQIVRDNGNYVTWAYLYIPWIVSIVLAVLILRKAFPYNGLFKKLNRNKLEADLQQ